MSESHGGSCEPCKKKKCKCDRQLPVCGQCAAWPLLCKYAESNKRGIPGGYISALEARLNETEIALYNALCELRSLNPKGKFLRSASTPEPLVSRHQNNTSKASKMAGWKQQPLRTSDDMQNWWMSLCAEKGLTDQIQERPEIAEIYDGDFSHHAGTSGETSYRGIEHNTNSSPQDDIQSRASMSSRHIIDSCLLVPDGSGMEILNYRPDETGEGGISKGSWNTIPNEERLMQTNSGESSKEMDRSQRLSAMLSHIYY